MDTTTTNVGGEKRIAIVVIHGVGETDTGWINDYIVEPIGGTRRELKILPHSELHHFLDEGRSDPDKKFPTLVRRASIGSANISFIEMIWADLSRVASGPISYMADTLKLMFEAPDVLARAFLRRRWRGLHGLIALLVLTSSRLLSWFIVGLNLTVIACAAFMTAVWLLRSANFLPSAWHYDDSTLAFWLSPVISGLFVSGVWLYWRARHRDIGWSEFGRGIALSSAAILTYVVLATASAYWSFKLPFEFPALVSGFAREWQDKGDFDKGRTAIFLVWVAWCVSTLLSMALLLLVSLARALGWRPTNPVPVAATWGAIFNILVQAIVLKLIITPVSMLACTQLRNAYAAAKPEASTGTPERLCDVDISSGVFFFTLIETVFILVGLLCILYLRRSAALKNNPDDVPRLIVHPLLVALAALTVTAHIIVFAELMMNVHNRPGDYVNLLLMPAEKIGYNRLPSELLAFLVWLVPAYIAGIRAFHTAAAPMVHIARELVDHQYRVRPRLFGSFGDDAKRGGVRNEYPRRAPIAARLDSIMDNLVASRTIDKLVLVTHSQGSVIAFDYLRSREPSEAINSIGEIHVMTMGSPLSHIYGYYFDEYARPVRLTDLRGNLRSWVNFWRIDDPIGNRVDVVAGNFIDNRLLGRGGHVDYWREQEVRVHICRLLELPAMESAVAP